MVTLRCTRLVHQDIKTHLLLLSQAHELDHEHVFVTLQALQLIHDAPKLPHLQRRRIKQSRFTLVCHH